MGLNNGYSLDSRQKTWTSAIDRVLKIIKQQRDVSLPALQQIRGAIGTLYENIFHFIFYPVERVRMTISSKHAFQSSFWLDFYHELEGVFPERDERPFSEMILRIFESQIESGDQKGSSTIKNLKALYPKHAEKIQLLADLAKTFVQRKKNELQRVIKDYLGRKKVLFCWFKIMCRSKVDTDMFMVDLQERYNRMKQGKFIFGIDIPLELSDRLVEIDQDYPIIAFSELIKAYEEFLNSAKGVNEFHKLQQETIQYLYFRDGKQEHLEQKIIPLLRIREMIRNVVKWPAEYELSDEEKLYLSKAIYPLAFISNDEMRGSSLVPKKYLNISEQERSIALKDIESTDATTPQKREACRQLFYASIPWKALNEIGSLFHGCGGT